MVEIRLVVVGGVEVDGVWVGACEGGGRDGPSLECRPPRRGLELRRAEVEALRKRQLHRPPLEQRRIGAVDQAEVGAQHERPAASCNLRVQIAERRLEGSTERRSLHLAQALVASTQGHLEAGFAEGAAPLHHLFGARALGGVRRRQQRRRRLAAEVRLDAAHDVR
jgi:hypothetical protein